MPVFSPLWFLNRAAVEPEKARTVRLSLLPCKVLPHASPLWGSIGDTLSLSQKRNGTKLAKGVLAKCRRFWMAPL